MRWMFSGFMVVLVRNMVFECSNAPLEGCVPDGVAYLERLGLAGDSFGRSVGVMLALWVGLECIAFVVLALNKAKWMSP